MGRAPCCDKANVKKGPWSPEEDAKLREYIEKHGTGGNWIAFPHKAGLRRCGKSCRLRWLNYLRPNIKHGEFSEEEDKIICSLYVSIGSRWSIIAAQLQGRTDNDVKNYWNTKLKKKLMSGIIHVPLRKLQGGPFSTALQSNSSASASSASSTSPLSFKDRTNTHNNLETTHLGPISISFSKSLMSCTSSSVTHENYVSDFPDYKVKHSLFSFGGHEGSCSSSDGSCSNQIGQGQGQEAEYEFAANVGGIKVEQLDLQDSLKIGIQESQKFMPFDGWTERQNGIWRENSAEYEYGLEEIKQLVSTNSCNTFLFDENRTEERGLYYY